MTDPRILTHMPMAASSNAAGRSTPVAAAPLTATPQGKGQGAESDTDEKRTVQEAVARAVYAKRYPLAAGHPDFMDARPWLQGDVLEEAGLMLDALGLEQVGWRWYEPRPQAGWYFAEDFPPNTLTTPEPVYTMGASGSRPEGAR